MTEFRDGFWVSTTARFFYIHIFMKIFDIQNVFHIENDVMLYKKTNFLYEYIKENVCKIWNFFSFLPVFSNNSKILG